MDSVRATDPAGTRTCPVRDGALIEQIRATYDASNGREFFAEGRGWIPVDPSDVRHDMHVNIVTLEPGDYRLSAELPSGATLSAMARVGEQGHTTAWLSLDDADGQEYWAAMNLMGQYAAANHAIIHQKVAKHIGAHVVAGVENHHNFAWKEKDLTGNNIIVHRKGATPAGNGVLGIIPGSMATPGFIVRGKGEPDSLNSASHGAGRAAACARRAGWCRRCR